MGRREVYYCNTRYHELLIRGLRIYSLAETICNPPPVRMILIMIFKPQWQLPHHGHQIVGKIMHADSPS